MDTHDIDQRYNEYIAQSLGIDEGFDYMNNSEAIKEAEEEISSQGLENEYLQALNKMNESGPDRATLGEFRARKPGFRALAIVKMFKKRQG
ncbi:MAG: hypothetical protein F6K04_21035 [Leptolyngbya sp. SIO4C5]|nr:hypothetical protein [Leptolyngbya sp. SIO4C5]